MRKRIVTCLVLAILLGLAGCNMVAGAGKDITWTAEKVDTWIVD